MCALFVLFLIANTQAYRAPDEALLRKRDMLPKPFGYPVDFNRVYKNGYVEPGANFREDYSDPADDLPKTNEEAEERLKKLRKEGRFSSPQEELEYYRRRDAADSENDAEDDKNATRNRLLFDLPALQEHNIKEQHSLTSILRDKEVPPASTDNNPKPSMQNPNIASKTQYFKPGSFILDKEYQNMRKSLNWTSCDEFGRGASFHPASIVNLQWVPFYIWSLRKFSSAVIHTFYQPTLKLVHYYKETYSPYLPKIDWNQPKLVMKEYMESLLIAEDRRGLFRLIPKIELPLYVIKNKVQIPSGLIRLKIEDPYLCMMYCNEAYATVMAVINNVPATDREKRLEADTIGFRGKGRPVSRDLRMEMIDALGEMELNKQKSNVTKPAPKKVEIDEDY